MNDQNRRAEIKRHYKETRKVERGICSLTCTATDEVWVDSSNDLASSENRIQFALKTGTAVHPELVGKVKEHGNQAFSFAVLEVFDGELSQYELDKLRKSRRQFWIEKLSARSLFR